MDSVVIRPDDLYCRLIDRGHCVEDLGADGRVSVLPPPDIIVTIALDPDPTQDLNHRQRYFVVCCSDNGDPAIFCHPYFLLSKSFSEAASQERPVNDYAKGPVVWLLQRLSTFGRVLVWPNGIAWRRNPGGRFLEDGVFDDLPQIRPWMGHPGQSPLPEDMVAIGLDVTEPADCKVIWRIANFSARSCDEFFMADANCNEVYYLHHHEKIIVSIPDDRTRANLVGQLVSRTDLFTDYSGFTTLPQTDPPEAVE